MAWDLIWSIYRWLKGKEEEEEEEEIIREAEKKSMTKEEALSLIYQTRMEKLVQQIDENYRKAKAYLESVKDQIENPAVKNIVEVYLKVAEEWDKKDYRVLPAEHNSHKIPIIILAEAIQKGKHKDPKELLKYLAGKTYALTRKILTEYLQGLKIEHLEELAKRKGMNVVDGPDYLYSYVNPIGMFYRLHKLFDDFSFLDVTDTELHMWFKNFTRVFLRPWGVERLDPAEILTRPGNFEEVWHNRVKEKAMKYWKKFGVGDEKLVEEILEKPIEEWEEMEEEEEPAPAGAPILAHPDRYPTLTQKILLKTLILGELQKINNKGVHRNLYRALRNLMAGPSTTSNWAPFLLEWFEELEKGRYVSPLTLLLQKLPVNPALKQGAYRYLARIERGERLEDIPGVEKEGFKQVMEQVKLEIWRDPERYLPVVDKLLYTIGVSREELVKALVGVIDDLTRICVGEKTPRQISLERDVTLIFHVIKSLDDMGNYIDPYQVARGLTDIIEQNIQDQQVREAYKKTIQYYLETIHQIPRGHEYLEWIVERERELEDGLGQLVGGAWRLGDRGVEWVVALYRTLILLTPYPTLRETKLFYDELVDMLRVGVGGEEFIPVHGPIGSELASSFQRIVMAKPEERVEMVRAEIVGYEALLYATPHLERMVEGILAESYDELVDIGGHRDFIVYVSRLQTRLPMAP